MPGSNSANSSVTSGITNFSTKADLYIDATNDALDAIGSNQIGFASPNQGSLPDWGSEFWLTINSEAPSFTAIANISDYNVPKPSQLQVNYDIDVGNIPVDNTDDFIFTNPVKPDDLAATPPGDAPVILDKVLPDVPVITDIAVPQLEDITFPLAPTISIPTFSGVLPGYTDITPPSGEFSFSEDSYSSDVLTKIQDDVALMLDSGVGIPDEIWDKIWSRSRDRENKLSVQASESLANEFSAKGFDMPPGMMAARSYKVQQELTDKQITISRDIAIKRAELEVDNLRFAVQQGIALESMVGGWYQQGVARALEAARYSYQATIELFNANVNFYNSKVQGYIAEANAYKVLLESEIIKLEAYKIELEGQKLVSDINKQDIEIYTAQNNALVSRIEVYKGQLEGVQTQVEIDNANISTYLASVQAFGEVVKAKNSEYVAYKTQVEAESVRAEVYETQIKSFGIQVDAFKSTNDIEIAKRDMQLRINDQKLKDFSANIEAYNTKIAGELSDFNAQVSVYDSKVKAYITEVEGQKAEARSKIDAQTLRVNYAQQDTETNIQWARNFTEASRASATLATDSTKTVAAVNAQLAASTMSAVNLGATISDGISYSTNEQI